MFKYFANILKEMHIRSPLAGLKKCDIRMSSYEEYSKSERVDVNIIKAYSSKKKKDNYITAVLSPMTDDR